MGPSAHLRISTPTMLVVLLTNQKDYELFYFRRLRLRCFVDKYSPKDGLNFQPKAMVVENKNRKFEFFFIACPAETYVKNTAYIFVDFRIKRAGSSNYGGLLFLPSCKKTSKKANIAIRDGGY